MKNFKKRNLMIKQTKFAKKRIIKREKINFKIMFRIFKINSTS